MKYEPTLARGRENMLWTSMSDGMKDGQTDHYRGPAERGPYNTLYIYRVIEKNYDIISILTFLKLYLIFKK